MRILAFLAALAALLSAGMARAQTAAQVQDGFITTTGCASAALTPCWKPWSVTNPLPVDTAVSAPVTPAAGTTGTLTTGGTSYTIVTGPVTGCYVYNGLTAAEQGGIAAAEPANIDPVATPVVGLVTTTTIQPGQPWSCPGRLATGVLVKANATTNGHKLNVVTW